MENSEKKPFISTAALGPVLKQANFWLTHLLLTVAVFVLFRTHPSILLISAISIWISLLLKEKLYPSKKRTVELFARFLYIGSAEIAIFFWLAKSYLHPNPWGTLGWSIFTCAEILTGLLVYLRFEEDRKKTSIGAFRAFLVLATLLTAIAGIYLLFLSQWIWVLIGCFMVFFFTLVEPKLDLDDYFKDDINLTINLVAIAIGVVSTFIQFSTTHLFWKFNLWILTVTLIGLIFLGFGIKKLAKIIAAKIVEKRYARRQKIAKKEEEQILLEYNKKLSSALGSDPIDLAYVAWYANTRNIAEFDKVAIDPKVLVKADFTSIAIFPKVRLVAAWDNQHAFWAAKFLVGILEESFDNSLIGETKKRFEEITELLTTHADYAGTKEFVEVFTNYRDRKEIAKKAADRAKQQADNQYAELLDKYKEIIARAKNAPTVKDVTDWKNYENVRASDQVEIPYELISQMNLNEVIEKVSINKKKIVFNKYRVEIVIRLIGQVLNDCLDDTILSTIEDSLTKLNDELKKYEGYDGHSNLIYMFRNSMSINEYYSKKEAATA